MESQWITEIKALIAKANELLDAGEYDALPDVSNEMFRIFRQIERGPGAGAWQGTMKEYFACREAMALALEADRMKLWGIRYTAVELEKMESEKLDDIVEKLVLRRRPHHGIVRRIRDSWLQNYTRRSANQCVAFLPRQQVPAYSESFEGMGLIIEKMQDKGYTITIEPSDKVRFFKDGKETAYSLLYWNVNLPKTVAITAVLAEQ